MSNRINILDDLTINKIAAGEVVERPSSVVKELIENSIDAHSNKIVIDISDGGKKLIRITDNGVGIASSEVDKSFLRHATSKISKVEDLYNLYSLGFRGEALASISAVSKLEMVTKTKEEPIGTKVLVEGGKVVTKEPIGCVNGTTIIIKDIFFNTPARQKFLKSTHAETINISDYINKLAIGNPDIQFKYINNNKTMLNTPGDGKLLNTIRSIYGKDVSENLIEIDFKSDNFKLSGFVGTNNVYRSNRNLQHMYINNRFVKSKVILNAISEGYKSIIPINKHAVCFLNIEIAPSNIDVNIHPNKMEIKFENEQEIYVELRDYLKRKLLGSNLIGKYQVYSNTKNTLNPLNKQRELNGVIKEEEIKLISTSNDTGTNIRSTDLNKRNDIEKKAYNKEEKNIEVATFSSDDDLNSFKSVSEVLDNINNINRDNSDTKLTVDNINKDSISILDDIEESIQEESVKKGSIKEEFTKEEHSKEEHSKEDSLQEEFFEDKSFESSEKNLQELDTDLIKESSKVSFRSYNVIGTIFNTYIILNKKESMYLLDQHAAHERILYEEYMTKFFNHNINMQMLLDPIVMELSNVDILQIEKHIDLFMNFGFEIELFGNNHIVVRSVPNIFGIPESEKFILQIIDNIDDIKSNYELKDEKFASMACRAAIKANDRIYDIEIDKLLVKLEECENPFTCPHGRPITVEISKTEIEKMFKRIM